ncbi:MAG: hypothetical protein WAU32_11960, partial [Thermoanaerobaculia bacterium]
PITEEQGVAGLDVFGEVWVSDGDLLPGAEDLPRGQGKQRASFKYHRPRSNLADPDLQPREILKDGDGPTQALGDSSHSRHDLEVLGLCSV